MIQIPAIDMAATGQNIARLRNRVGISVKDLQDIFGFSTPQAFTNGSTVPLFPPSITWQCWRLCSRYPWTISLL